MALGNLVFAFALLLGLVHFFFFLNFPECGFDGCLDFMANSNL